MNGSVTSTPRGHSSSAVYFLQKTLSDISIYVLKSTDGSEKCLKIRTLSFSPLVGADSNQSLFILCSTQMGDIA